VTDRLPHLILLAHAAATLVMVGVIWFVQVIHYPLLAEVAPADLPRYEREHTRRAAWVIGPPMLLELATGILLLWLSPAGVAPWQAVAGLVLLAVVWASTQLVQVPCHTRLSREFDAACVRRLVATNWVRTTAWSLRGLLVLWMCRDTLA